MKFIQTHKDWNDELLETVTIETRDDIQIDDALEAFGRFLRAAGYIFDGEIQIVDPEDKYDPLDDDQDWSFDEDEDDDTSDVNEMIPAFEGPIVGFQDPYEATQPVTNSPWPFPSSSKP